MKDSQADFLFKYGDWKIFIWNPNVGEWVLCVICVGNQLCSLSFLANSNVGGFMDQVTYAALSMHAQLENGTSLAWTLLIQKGQRSRAPWLRRRLLAKIL
jgi:hypothetical protein